LQLSSSLSELRRLTDFVELFCQTVGASSEDRIALQVCLQEITTNIITHGYKNEPDHTLIVTVKADPTCLRATVIDAAPAFDPIAYPEVDITLPAEQRPIGGLGIHLIKRFGNPQYERREHQNVLTVTRLLSSPKG
jgi:anti-sigma regulatory factor (Ser/Thr protein kinase)